MRQAGKEKIVTKKNDDFIMLPTVDVCFRGLMYNPKVRKGFIAALLGQTRRLSGRRCCSPRRCDRNTRTRSWASWMSGP